MGYTPIPATIDTRPAHVAQRRARAEFQPLLMSDPHRPRPHDALSARVSPDSSAILRRALRDAVGSDRVNAALREAIRRTCAEARARGLRPEELIVGIKRLWFDTPEVALLAHGGSGHVLLDRIVSTTIDEYFGG